MSLIIDLKQEEGFRPHYYKDSRGFLTIGYGYNLDEGMSENVASILLMAMIAEKSDELQAMLPFWEKLTQARQEVFIDMAYNLGTAGLMQFKNMLQCASKGDVDGVCREMQDSAWYSQVGQRAVNLIAKYRQG